MHQHRIVVFGLEVPIPCETDVQAALSLLPFTSYYWWLTKMVVRGLWARLWKS